MRLSLAKMQPFIASCRMNLNLERLIKRKYLIESPHHYSLQDLIQIHSGQFVPMLMELEEQLYLHITQKCEVSD